jgi:phosphatidylinositol-3-phosphatase
MLAGFVLVLLAVALGGLVKAPTAAAQQPRVGHVFTIMLENKDYADAFGKRPGSRYLARTLRRRGALAKRYYATAHQSLPNYLTMISGQAPTRATRNDCPEFDCIYDETVRTLPDTLEAAGHTWGGYFEDIPAACALPVEGQGDPFPRATRSLQYAQRHNPFSYFRSITTDRDRCRRHVRGMRALRRGLGAVSTTPSWSFIVPDFCHSGHDDPCPNPRESGGWAGIGAFLRRWVPRILASPAFRRDGLLVITFDEAEDDDRRGGGRVGALLISPLIEPGSTIRATLDHYGYLRSMEDLFGLQHLGPAARTFQAARAFG